MNTLNMGLASKIQRDFRVEKLKKKALEASRFLAFATFFIALLILASL